MPTDSPKDTRLSPIVTSFRGNSFVIVSGSGRGRVSCWIALGRGSVGAGWPKLETFIGSRVKSYRVGGSDLAARGSVGVRVAPYPLPT